MKKNNIFILLLMMITTSPLSPHAITALFIDIEVIFKANALRASSYIGKFDALHYMASVGSLPSQEELFKQLKPIKALSTQITYNDNLALPLILSDWLATVQQPTKIQSIIQHYLNKKNISDIEQKVFLAIINMMLTPQHLADIQQVSPKIEALLKSIVRAHYKLYLVGNWANINSLKQKFPDLFKLFQHVFPSGDLHLLKPSIPFYTKVLELSNINTAHALWIETEPKFFSALQQNGHQAILYNANQHDHLINSLHRFGIKY